LAVEKIVQPKKPTPSFLTKTVPLCGTFVFLHLPRKCQTFYLRYGLYVARYSQKVR